jgi:hypothetical protein
MEQKGSNPESRNSQERVRRYRGLHIGIRAGRLEYREGAIWGNPYLRVLRSQLEKYIGDELGQEYLEKAAGRLDLRKIKKEIPELKEQISELERRLHELEDRKTYLEELLKK